jgi:hypothetical protein
MRAVEMGLPKLPRQLMVCGEQWAPVCTNEEHIGKRCRASYEKIEIICIIDEAGDTRRKENHRYSTKHISYLCKRCYLKEKELHPCALG